MSDVDDLAQAMSDPGSYRKQVLLNEAFHNQMKSQQYDIMRVVNPKRATVQGIVYDLPERDFYVEYDTKQFQKVAYGETKDMPRPKAERFVTHKTDDIINFITDKMHKEQIAEREAKGLPSFKNKYDENEETYLTAKYPKTNDQTVRDEIIEQIFLGYTMISTHDAPPADPYSGETSMSGKDYDTFDRIAKRKVNVPAPTPPSPFTDLNQQLTPEEVSNV